MLWYGTAINRHKPVHTSTYLLVPHVTILGNSAFQRSALDIHRFHMYIHLNALYIMTKLLHEVSEHYLTVKNYKRGNNKDYIPIEKTEHTRKITFVYALMVMFKKY